MLPERADKREWSQDLLRPASVLVVGPLARHAHTLTTGQRHVIAFTEDPAVASCLYDKARATGLCLLPLVMDFTKPTPSRGVGSYWLVSATSRLRCEMVVAVGASDYAARVRHLNPDQIIESLSALTTRWLVLDVTSDAFITALSRGSKM